jgi:mRNA-degrading endonuclease toxin of MazEF toxin-antitoxin module
VALPTPEPGLLIHYEYLWRWQALDNRDTAAKARPAVIVLVAGDGPDVIVVPVTTQPSPENRETVEIPANVSGHLGLDASRTSRVVVDEINMFQWPNDLAPVPGQEPGSYHYGFVPPRLFERIKQAVLKNRRSGKLQSVKRRS